MLSGDLVSLVVKLQLAFKLLKINLLACGM